MPFRLQRFPQHREEDGLLMSICRHLRCPRSRNAGDRSIPEAKAVSKVALSLLEFHRSRLIVIYKTILAFRAPHGSQFIDDGINRIRSGSNCSTAMRTPKGTHP